MTLLAAIAFLWICASAYFFWPLVAPHWTRTNASTRLLDRLEEEWEREMDDIPRRFDERPW